MPEDQLFDMFSPISKKDWREKIVEDLDDKTIEHLIWKTPEGIDIFPFYTQEDFEPSTTSEIFFSRAAQEGKEAREWENLESVKVSEPQKANKIALEALNSGADGLLFEVEEGVPDFTKLLKGIFLDHCSIYFRTAHDFSHQYFDYARKQHINPESLSGGILLDNYTDTVDTLKNLTIHNYRCIYINAASNGKVLNCVQELSAAVSKTVAALDFLTDKGIDPQKVLHSTTFGFPTGGSYFMEIAKLRAFRVLIAMVAKAYKIKEFTVADIHILSSVTGAIKEGDDPDNDMIRHTTRAMSAILGGCNAILISPAQALEEKGATLSGRIARNISLVLKEEAYFNKVNDPSAGSFFIEALTKQLVEKAWQEFLTINP